MSRISRGRRARRRLQGGPRGCRRRWGWSGSMADEISIAASSTSAWLVRERIALTAPAVASPGFCPPCQTPRTPKRARATREGSRTALRHAPPNPFARGAALSNFSPPRQSTMRAAWLPVLARLSARRRRRFRLRTERPRRGARRQPRVDHFNAQGGGGGHVMRRLREEVARRPVRAGGGPSGLAARSSHSSTCAAVLADGPRRT